MPLTIDYEERLYAAGKIPGSFFRREGRPGQEAILFGRLTDRPLRPLFPKGFHNEVQVIITVLSVDKENPPEILGMVGASAALSISEIPFDGPVGASRVAHIGDSYTVNPTYSEMDKSDLSAVVAGTRDAVMMVESGSNEVPEEVALEAIRRCQEANGLVIDMIEEIVTAVGKTKMAVTIDLSNDGLTGQIDTILNGRLSHTLEAGSGKVERERALHDLEAEVQERLEDQYPKEKIADSFEDIVKKLMRTRILEEGIRPDGRGLTDIRPISCEVGLLPRTHGSGLFTRGQTQVLSIATLASVEMAQTLDTLGPENSKRFMHHYNFTPYSTGEVKRVGSPGRREIGHGALAERAVQVALPDEEAFPYVIRIVSEVLSSNGSTSMASVCGSTLALLDAGVPMKRPVAGVAMGLIKGEDSRFAVLTDIEGMEDHLGDMDFKVAGTTDGINALQLDVKTKGLTPALLQRAMAQAKEGRLFILDKMREAIAEPRSNLSPYAPKVVRMTIPIDKIGALIGPGGRTIRGIQEETGVSIDTEDDGTVLISGVDDAMIKRAQAQVDGLTREIVVGDIFTGKVVRLTSFGAFVELTPGKDGLVRMEELGDAAEDLDIGREITVIVQEIDHLGRINLSRRALFGGADPSETPPRPMAPPSGPRPGMAPMGGRGPRPGGRGDGRPPMGRGRGGPPRSGPGGGRRPPSRPGFRGPGR
jgi:polyribonucleotide nucleotidyltransferase